MTTRKSLPVERLLARAQGINDARVIVATWCRFFNCNRAEIEKLDERLHAEEMKAYREADAFTKKPRTRRKKEVRGK